MRVLSSTLAGLSGDTSPRLRLQLRQPDVRVLDRCFVEKIQRVVAECQLFCRPSVHCAAGCSGFAVAVSAAAAGVSHCCRSSWPC